MAQGDRLSAARGRVLDAVRKALEGRAVAAHPGAAPLPSGNPAAFASALREADGEVVELRPGEARAWLATFAAGFRTVACAADVPAELRPPLPAVSPSEAELGVSLAAGAAADTGSLLLTSDEGRALQLLPPVHLVWLEAERLHPTLGEALDRLRASSGLPSALGLHTGPSRSADIGRIVVRGVHGPARVVAALLR